MLLGLGSYPPALVVKRATRQGAGRILTFDIGTVRERDQLVCKALDAGTIGTWAVESLVRAD